MDEATTDPADDELRRRLIDGDETALGRVYDLHGPYLHRIAVRLTGNRTAADDVLQEVLCSLWQHPEAFDPERGTLRRWLSTLAHRRSVDLVRREASGLRRLRLAGADPSVPTLSSTVAPEETAVASVLGAQVRRAVASLPGPQRRAVYLAYFEGLSYRQVAEALGIPEGTAKSRLRLGLHRLSSLLAAKGITSCP
ncbi:RNA polymerase sigma factor [Cellulomonas sp. NPDC055163]